MADDVAQQSGENICKVFRIVMKGHVYFSKEYTRMVKRNACVVLLSNGKIGEISYFIWDKESGDAFCWMSCAANEIRKVIMGNNQFLLKTGSLYNAIPGI